MEHVLWEAGSKTNPVSAFGDYGHWDWVKSDVELLSHISSPSAFCDLQQTARNRHRVHGLVSAVTLEWCDCDSLGFHVTFSPCECSLNDLS